MDRRSQNAQFYVQRLVSERANTSYILFTYPFNITYTSLILHLRRLFFIFALKIKLFLLKNT